MIYLNSANYSRFFFPLSRFLSAASGGSLNFSVRRIEFSLPDFTSNKENERQSCTQKIRFRLSCFLFNNSRVNVD